MTANENTKPFNWYLASAPHVAAATFPFPCLHYQSYPFTFADRMLSVLIVIGWTSLAILAVIGIAICMLRGSKHQQLVALMSIPAFVPIAGTSLTMLYLMGYCSMQVL